MHTLCIDSRVCIVLEYSSTTLVLSRSMHNTSSNIIRARIVKYNKYSPRVIWETIPKERTVPGTCCYSACHSKFRTCSPKSGVPRTRTPEK